MYVCPNGEPHPPHTNPVYSCIGVPPKIIREILDNEKPASHREARLTTWNYRLTVQTVDGEDEWAVREIYYDETGTPVNWSASSVAASGSSWLACADELSRMAGVVGLPAWDIDASRWCDRRRESVGAAVPLTTDLRLPRARRPAMCYNDGPPHPRTECSVDHCGLEPA